MVKQISDNEMYLLIKYIKSVLWRVAKRLSFTEDAWCLKVKAGELQNKTKEYYHYTATSMCYNSQLGKSIQHVIISTLYINSINTQ